MLVRKQHFGEEENEPPDPETPISRWGDMAEDDIEEEHDPTVGLMGLMVNDTQESDLICEESKSHPRWRLQQTYPPATRGIANDKSQNRLSKLINKWDPDIVGIAEPMISPDDFSKAYLQSLGMSSCFFSNNSLNRVPNIWLFWKTTVDTPNLLCCSNQQITVEVDGVLLSIIHAHCSYVNRRQLWMDLHQFSLMNLPWLILGDFNAYLSYSDKQGGHRPSTAAMSDFRDFIGSNHLMEAPCKGFHFSWWNKQVGRLKILGKLDRMFFNILWSSKYPGWNYKVCNRLCSGHSPIVGRSVDIPRPKNVPFKFFNMWCSHPSFRDTVKAIWDVPLAGHSIYIMTQKLKQLKSALKVWNREIFGNIKFQVEEESKSLELMQKHFDQGNTDEDFNMQMVNQENKVEKLLEQEQMFWRQKAGASWENDNDRSTKFFHAMANTNRSKSLISELKNNEGHTISIQEEIGLPITATFISKHVCTIKVPTGGTSIKLRKA
ncbi:hypothetical protein IFM89_015300 [Coptis chinensis]|uniref:Endonuclease/exonuclease/phosphatase domain-containing protein n=1 Tax=Coptis chinensis TaxID=261450 RepID=A0A835M5Z0_9MAGN|nr:hypothetical protein IFM89_015300 [Coptis chinensis]